MVYANFKPATFTLVMHGHKSFALFSGENYSLAELPRGMFVDPTKETEDPTLLLEDCFNGWKNLKDQNGVDKT
ncbi:unnamed protein product [Dovyalis caffra]|uniref:Uncharacterized protein n=1 Tax=Dovyalis caffra TaxID=77055 RepID=A0AAV1QTV5_9ROSI|nr:unnamed protein product [Dovyalis caffra]